ncbi:MAG: hypothetical protein NTZ67_07565 [Gammaproteobacteria bacterium]|nr:hypothetical protein [Gammaproteobacteria bacterium]
MNKFLFIFLLIIFNSLAYSASYSKNLSGNYNCNGTEVNLKKPFSCIMQVKRTNQTYALKATCNDHSTYNGTGIFNKLKHVLSIVFVNPKNAEETGLIVSNVSKNGTLHSTWTYLHKTTVASGFCFKNKK